MTINGRNFYGLFKSAEVFEAICDSLIEPPSRCFGVYVEEGGSAWGTILLILLIMTVGFLLALFVYTKVIRREMNQQLSL